MFRKTDCWSMMMKILCIKTIIVSMHFNNKITHDNEEEQQDV
jgi:hypothetical protein